MKEPIKDLPLLGHLRTIEDALYVEYDIVMELNELSKHKHHLEKRKIKYPKHIKEIEGKVYMSIELAETLAQHHKNLKHLESLQRKYGINES